MVVRLHDPEDPAPLLDIRATTLRIVSPEAAGRYLLDEIPSPWSAPDLARALLEESWCAEAEAFWALTAPSPTGLRHALGASAEQADAVVDVRDPTLGRIAYALFSTPEVARATLDSSAP